MSDSAAVKEYEQFLDEQIRHAKGMRLEMLKKQGEGEKKLLVDVIWPVRKSFKGITLEKEIVTLTGVKAYIDAYDDTFRFGKEGEGFVSHAENITRPRFDFERNKIRSMAALGIIYVPFSWDDMDKRPEVCRRALYELYGRYGANAGSVYYQSATLYEREVIRYGLRLSRPIRIGDVMHCLQKKRDFSIKVIKSMIVKRMIRPLDEDATRHHMYILEEEAHKFLW